MLYFYFELLLSSVFAYRMKTSNALLMLSTCVIAMGTVTAAEGDSGRGKHKKMYLVPTPGKVVIDGKLDDWDLSGQLFMYIARATSEMKSVKYAMMYDDDAVYISGDVLEDSPMMNRYDPAAYAGKGWDADCCQFRMVVDPNQGYPVNQGSLENAVPNPEMIHMTMWYYTDKQQPVLQIATGMNYASNPEWKDGVVPNALFAAKYVKKEDGRGYTFEYRIPWNTLSAKVHPRAGDLVPGTVQLNFSSTDGLSSAGGWVYDIMSAPGFTFQSSAVWGKLIFSKTGNLNKSLVEEGVRPALPVPLTFAYDLPESSEVSIQLYDKDGTVVRNLVASSAREKGSIVEKWDGLDETGKPLSAGSYTWKGLYHQPLSTKFLLSVHNSGQPAYKTDDNTGGWGGDHGGPTAACAFDQGMLLGWGGAESGWGLIRTDLTGKKIWGSKDISLDMTTDGTFIYSVTGYPEQVVKKYALGDGRALSWQQCGSVLPPPPGGNAQANGPTSVTCSAGKIYVGYARRNLIGIFDAASGVFLKGIVIPAPGRMVVTSNGGLLVISGESLIQVNGDAIRPIIQNHLDAPKGIALDGSGSIFVANTGKLQNVSVFSPDGAYVRSIGKVGGRPRMGAYDPNGLLEPGGIAIDGQNKLWVTETLDSPKRISVWKSTDGTFAKEFFGAGGYSTATFMDPRNPTEVFCHGVIWVVDIDKGTWFPKSTCWRPSGPDMIGEFAVSSPITSRKGGRQYFLSGLNFGRVVAVRVGDVAKPFAALISNYKGNPYIAWPQNPIFTDRASFPDGEYVWQDANDDQTIQAAELIAVGRSEVDMSALDADLNIWCNSGVVFRPIRVATDGCATYDFTKPEKTIQVTNEGMLAVSPTDGSLVGVDTEKQTFGCWSPDGKTRWKYTGAVGWKAAVNLPPVTPGKLYGPTAILGIAGNYTGIGSYFGPVQIYTTDGQFVGQLLRDMRTGGGLGSDVIACESFNMRMVQMDASKRYLLLGGDQDGRVQEILGLDTVKYLPGGTYAISEADAAEVQKGLNAYNTEIAKGSTLDVVRGIKALADARPIEKSIDEKRQFAARVAYDDSNLYVQYDIGSPYGLNNGIADPQTIFKGGNALDLQIATDPTADAKRTTPAPGDVRILVTMQNGKPLAVIYRPKVKGFTGKHIVLSSPTGTESFDSIDMTDGIAVNYKAISGSFRAILTIPLALLDWKPKCGDQVRMDLGYLFGINAEGTRTSKRVYWSNNGFAANITDDVPNESRLEPQNWGMAVVE